MWKPVLLIGTSQIPELNWFSYSFPQFGSQLPKLRFPRHSLFSIHLNSVFLVSPLQCSTADNYRAHMKRAQRLTMGRQSCFTTDVQVYLLHCSTYTIWWGSLGRQKHQIQPWRTHNSSIPQRCLSHRNQSSYKPPEVILTLAQPTKSRKELFRKGREWLQYQKHFHLYLAFEFPIHSDLKTESWIS